MKRSRIGATADAVYRWHARAGALERLSPPWDPPVVEGPLPFWQHAHRMTPDGENACVLEDRIEYALPLGRAGDLAGGLAIRPRLERMFAYGHAVTAGDLADHAACPETRP